MTTKAANAIMQNLGASLTLHGKQLFWNEDFVNKCKQALESIPEEIASTLKGMPAYYYDMIKQELAEKASTEQMGNEEFDDDEDIPVVDMPDDFDHASDRDQQRYFYMAMETLRDKGTLESSTDDDIMALAEQLYDTDNKRKDDATSNIIQAINRKY